MIAAIYRKTLEETSPYLYDYCDLLQNPLPMSSDSLPL